jgi:hypothetical protein
MSSIHVAACGIARFSHIGLMSPAEAALFHRLAALNAALDKAGVVEPNLKMIKILRKLERHWSWTAEDQKRSRDRRCR